MAIEGVESVENADASGSGGSVASSSTANEAAISNGLSAELSGSSDPLAILPDPLVLTAGTTMNARAAGEAVIIAMDIVEVGGKWFVNVTTDLGAGATSRIEISVLEGTSKVLTESTMQKVNMTIDAFEAQAQRAGRRVGILRVGTTISLGLLFLLGIEASAPIGTSTPDPTSPFERGSPAAP